MHTWYRGGTAAVALTAALLCAGEGLAARGDITLLGSMSLPNAAFVTDVWGWVDPATMREYAIVGDWHSRKIFIVDATDPARMELASEVSGVPGFDVKVWDHYVYACDGDVSSADSRVIDIADPYNPVLSPTLFSSAHNISISPDGIMFLELPGVRFFDIATNPLSPRLLVEDLGEFRDGHDSTPRGNRLYDFRGREGTVIWDITDPANPDTLGIITGPGITYHHSGDAFADGSVLFINDELAVNPQPDITVWDVSDPAFPVRIATISDPGATVHNLYLENGLAYVSYYSSGFKVIDVSDPSAPVVLDRYDTSALSGEGYVGAFGVYPFTPSGRVYVTDIDNGLFVFDVDTATVAPAPPREDGATLEQNVPNPFNPATTIRFRLAAAGRVELSVYDVRGQRVRTLLRGPEGAGRHEAVWNGDDDGGRPVASGVYFYRLRTPSTTVTRRMVLVK